MPATIPGPELCKLTDLTDSTHRQIARDGWIPAPTDGDYPFADTIRGMFAYLRREREQTPAKLAATRKATVDAELAEIELRRARNEVIETDTVFRVWETVSMAIKRVIETSKLSSQEKDAIYRELESIKTESYEEQKTYDAGQATR